MVWTTISVVKWPPPRRTEPRAPARPWQSPAGVYPDRLGCWRCDDDGRARDVLPQCSPAIRILRLPGQVDASGGRPPWEREHLARLNAPAGLRRAVHCRPPAGCGRLTVYLSAEGRQTPRSRGSAPTRSTCRSGLQVREVRQDENCRVFDAALGFSCRFRKNRLLGMLRRFGYLAPVPWTRSETDAIPLAIAGFDDDHEARDRGERRLPGQDGRETGPATANPRA